MRKQITLDLFRERFKSCMSSLYTEGVSTRQHADLIRIFVMGLVVALESYGHFQLAKEALLALEFTTDSTWTPDDTWRWW